MGYLICEDCGGYYELKPYESPEEFETCTCGGELYFIPLLDEVLKEQRKINAKNKFNQRINDEKMFESMKNQIKNPHSRYYSNKQFIILLIGGFFLITLVFGRSLLRIAFVFGPLLTLAIFVGVIGLGLFIFIIGVSTKGHY